jgi:hypothetical protein
MEFYVIALGNPRIQKKKGKKKKKKNLYDGLV